MPSVKANMFLKSLKPLYLFCFSILFFSFLFSPSYHQKQHDVCLQEEHQIIKTYWCHLIEMSNASRQKIFQKFEDEITKDGLLHFKNFGVTFFQRGYTEMTLRLNRKLMSISFTKPFSLSSFHAFISSPSSSFASSTFNFSRSWNSITTSLSELNFLNSGESPPQLHVPSSPTFNFTLSTPEPLCNLSSR